MASSVAGIAPPSGMCGRSASGRRGAPGRPSRLRVREAFAEGVQPDHLAAERGRFGEQRGIGGERDAQTGLHQVRREAGRVGGMRGDGGDVGEQVLGGDRPAVGIRRVRARSGGPQVWFGAGSIRPQSGKARPPNEPL